MKSGKALKTISGYIWKVPICALAYVVGTMAGGALVSALGMKLPSIPEQANEQTMALSLLAASLVLTVGIGPLARRIQGAYLVRWLTLGALTYVCLGVNTPIEAAIFTTMGGMRSVVVFSLLPCLLFAGVMALVFKPSEKGEPFGLNVRRFFSGRSAGDCVWRFAAAICAVPVIYWIFGMCVAPWVVEYYKQGQFRLTLPNVRVIVLVQLLRSSLFLLVSLPILIMWSGSRLRLTVALGVAFFVLVGLFGLIQVYWLGPVLLVLHNVEILADSLVYAGALVFLLVRKKVPDSEPQAVLPSLSANSASYEGLCASGHPK